MMFRRFVLVALACIFTGFVSDQAHANSARAKSSLVRITSIKAFDTGSVSDQDAASTAIDVVQDICSVTDDDSDGVPEDIVLEPFTDTLIAIEVVNNSSSTIRFNKFSYRLQNADGGGNDFVSRKLALVGSSEVAPTGEAVQVIALAFDATDGLKYFHNKTTAIPSTLGFRNITFKLEGKTTRGKSVNISARVALSFDNFDRCASS